MDNKSLTELLKELDKYYNMQEEIEGRIKVLQEFILYKFGKIGRDNRC